LSEKPNNVIYFSGMTSLPLPATRLRDNIDWDNVESALVIALDKDGVFEAYANNPDSTMSLFLAQKFAHKMLAGDYGEG